MKIKILSTYDCFGAGTAAYRLYKGLKNMGHAADIVVAEQQHSDSTKVEECGIAEGGYTYIANMGSKAKCTPFSTLHFGLSEDALERAVEGADLVNIHWVNNFISVDNINSLVNKGIRVVVTIHDENLYTGGCHYRNGCEQHLDCCGNCPQLWNSPQIASSIFESKLKRIPLEVAIVAPSKWLAEQAAKSVILRGHRIEVISNGVDKNVFTPENRQAVRNNLKLDDSDFLILFGAQNFDDKRKGSKYLLEMLKKLREDNHYPFKCIALGQIPPEFSDNNIISEGYIRDQEQIAGYYAAADVVALPSLEDNLPNVMLEGLMCGTPVVGFNVGGVGEGIIDGKNGFLVAPGDVGGLTDRVRSIMRTKGSMREYARADAVVRFDLPVMASRYIELFQSVPVHSQTNYCVDTIWQAALDAELHTRIQTEGWLKQERWITKRERRFTKMYDKAFQILLHEYVGHRKIAVYGNGIIGKHILQVMGRLVDYIIDAKEIDDARYFPPDKLSSLRDSDVWILVTPIDCGDIADLLKRNGFQEKTDYILFRNLEE